MNSLIEHIYKTRRVKDSEENLINPFPVSISYDEGMVLYNLIRKTKVESTLEVGMAYGLSTLFICQAHHDNGAGHHTAIDPLERTSWKSIGLLNIKKTGLDGILRFYEAHTHEILPRLLLNKERFDFIFIDGSHFFDYILTDFFYADGLLDTGGYIIFHDLWFPSVRKALAFILRNRNYKLASEFFGKPYPLWEECLRFVKNLIQNPLDIYSWGFPIAKKCFNLHIRYNYCVMKKISDDDRKGNYYKSF